MTKRPISEACGYDVLYRALFADNNGNTWRSQEALPLAQWGFDSTNNPVSAAKGGLRPWDNSQMRLTGFCAAQ